MSSTPGSNLPATYSLKDAASAAVACRTMADAMAEPTLAQLTRHANHVQVVTALVALIENGMRGFDPKRRLSTDHVLEWAKRLAEDWSNESMADLALFLRHPSKYDGGEFYSAVDVERITRWWTAYLAQKASALEGMHAGIKRWIDPWNEIADKLTAMLRARGDRQPTEEEDNEEAELRLQLADLEAKRMATADGWRRLRLALAADRRPVDNLSAEHDRIRREVPMMTVEQLRAAWKKHPDAWSRRIILHEANHRGLMDEYMRTKLAETDDDAKAEARAITEAGLTTPLPPNE